MTLALGQVPQVTYDGLFLGSGLSQQQRRANLLYLRQLVQTIGLDTTQPLPLPRGRIEVYIDSVLDAVTINGESRIIGITLTHDITIVGYGSDETTIAVYPRPPGFNYDLFYIDGVDDGLVVKLKGMTLENGSTWSAPPVQSNRGIWAFRYQGKSGGGETNSSELHLTDVAATGQWENVISHNDGDVLCDLKDCNFESHVINATWFAGNGETDSRFHAKDCTFTILSSADDSVCLYIHPTVAVDIRDCEFYGALRYGVYINGNPEGVPPYVTIQDCYFDDTMTYGIQTCKNGPTDISGCIFRCSTRGVFALDSFSVDNCNFQRGNAHISAGGTLTGNQCTVSGSRFVLDDASDPYSIGADTGDWSITGNQFTTSGVSSTLIRVTLSGTRAVITGNTFAQVGGSTWSAGVSVGSGNVDVLVKNNLFGELCAFEYNTVLAATSAYIEVSGNRFNGAPSYWEIQIISPTDQNGLLRGEDNYLKSGLISTATVGYMLLSPKRGVNPTPVTAAANMSVSGNFDVHHIGGSTGINNIYIWTNSGPGGGNPSKMFCGRVTFISDAGVAFSGSGNVPAVTLSAGEAITLIWDPRTLTWYKELDAT